MSFLALLAATNILEIRVQKMYAMIEEPNSNTSREKESIKIK